MSAPSLSTRPDRGGLLLLLLVAFLLPRWVRGGAADLETGRPSLQNFGQRDHHAHHQNWVAAQDRRGVRDFGSDGVALEDDGVSWRKLPVPGTTFVRKLACDPAGDALLELQQTTGVETM